MTGEPWMTVVVPTHERCASLRRLLLALMDQSLPPDRFDVEVAVDGSRDGTLEMLESLRPPYRLSWVVLAHAGRASACNAAVHASDGDLVVIVDDDMEPARSFLEAHREMHRSPGRRVVMGAVPVVVEEGAPPHIRYVAEKFDAHMSRLASGQHRFSLRDFYSGNASVRRADLLAVGGFDERFTSYGHEDLELGYRLVRHGVELAFAPDAVAWQHYEKTLGELARDELAKGRTAVLFARIHPDAASDLKAASLRRQAVGRRRFRRALVRASLSAGFIPGIVLRLLSLSQRVMPTTRHVGSRFALEYFHELGWELESTGAARRVRP